MPLLVENRKFHAAYLAPAVRRTIVYFPCFTIMFGVSKPEYLGYHDSRALNE